MGGAPRSAHRDQPGTCDDSSPTRNDKVAFPTVGDTRRMATAIHPVDEMLPAPKLFTLGLQHVLVMYAGAIAVPLIVGRALQLPPEDVAFLISADLFCCGVVSILQSLGLTPWFGVRMPVMMGASVAAVGSMVVMAGMPGVGITGIFGATIAAGLFGLLIAPFMSRIVRFFPPLVTGTVITSIGMSLFPVAINWAGGGSEAGSHYGAPEYLMLSSLVLVLMAIPMSFVNPRAGRSINLMIALLTYVVYSNLLSVSVARVAQGKLDFAVGVWAVHAGMALLLIFMFAQRMQLIRLRFAR